ncbi:MAG: uracil-DNA glycosylase [Rubricoccaceae bacterium]|nr:uracil-DNA glycosylase [Rubricoccaceae bacterium]
MPDFVEETRRILALQRELVGPIRFLTEPVPRPSADQQLPVTQPKIEAKLMETTTSEAIETSTESLYERIEQLIPPNSPLHEIDSLEELSDWLASNILTDIDRTRLNPVLGGGNPNADVMVVGEAPGAEEDKKGKPFVGRAGQLLDKILAAIDLSREENVYICNILKSRPPNNRDPRADEVEAHIPMLYKQIALVKPKIMLAVGKSAGNGLLQKKTSLTSMRGKFHDFHGVPLMVTFHPAALLRNPQWKRPTWEDVQLLRKRYDEILAEQV